MSIKIEDRLSTDQRVALAEFFDVTRPSARRLQAWFAKRGHPICETTAYHLRARLSPDGEAPHAYEHLKVDRLLKAEHREAYHALLRDPKTSGEDARRWLLAHGYDVGRAAVNHHRKRFTARVKSVHDAAELAFYVTQIARESGVGLITEAALTRFEQLLMERLFRTVANRKLKATELTELSKSVTAIVKNRDRIERVRRESDRDKRRVLRAAERVAKKKGATPQDVAERMRQMLGLKTKAVPLLAK